MKSAMAVPNSAVGKGGSLIGVIMWNAVTATSHTNRIVRGFQTSIMICLKRGLAPTIISRSEEHTSELQSLMRHSYAVFCLHKTILASIKKLLSAVVADTMNGYQPRYNQALVRTTVSKQNARA